MGNRSLGELRLIGNKRTAFLSILLVISALLTIKFPIFFVAVFLVFPFAFFADKGFTKKSLLFIYNFFFNLSLVILGPALLSVIGIPINLYSALAVLFFANLFILFRRQNVNKIVGTLLRPIENTGRYFALTLFVIITSVIAVGLINYMPASNTLAPLTHDPQAHAYYTKIIQDTGQADYFYSPGLHMLCLFVASVFGISIALSVHYVTYFTIALTALGVGVFLLWATKRKILALVATAAILSAPNPWLLPPTAGKNALILAGAYLTFILFCLYAAYRYKSVSFYIIFIASLTTLGLIHYPTFPYGFIVSLSFLVLATVATKYIHQQKVNWREIKLFSAGLAVALFAVFTWIKTHQSVFTELARVDKEGDIIPSRNLASFDNPSVGLMSDSVKILQDVVNIYHNQLFSHSPLFLYAFIASVPILIIGLAIKKYFWFSLTAFSVIIGMIALPFIIKLLAPESLKIISNGGPLLVFIPLSAILGYSSYVFIDLLRAKKVIWGVAATLLLVSLCFLVYFATDKRNGRQESIYKNNTSITEYDLEAYDWINNNLPGEEKFIVDAYFNKKRPNVIFSRGGGLWIPVFTDSKVSMPFEVHQFASKLTNDNYQLYAQIKEEDPSSKNAIEKLVNNGYRYYYQVKILGESKSINIQFVDGLKGVRATPIYNNEQVVIYRIEV